MGSNKNLQSVGKQDYGTPQALFDLWDKDFKFNLDACANAINKKLSSYISPEIDAFRVEWNCVWADEKYHTFEKPGRVWLNCPYGRGITEKWIRRAIQQVEEGNAEFVLMLLPASTGTSWFDLCRKGKIKFLKGRIKFDGAENSAMHDSMLVLFGTDPSSMTWKWDMQPSLSENISFGLKPKQMIFPANYGVKD